MRKLTAIVVAALCLLPAVAFAADPAKNSAFKYCETNDRCPFSFETTKDGRYIKDIKLYPKCAPVPVQNWGKIRVRDGRFSKSGTVTDMLDRKLTYTIKGRFKRPKKAVGTYEVERAGCKDKPVEFVARRYGKAQAGF